MSRISSWDDSLVTGHQTIDAQHRSLVDALDAIDPMARPAELKESLDFLISYAKTHFQAEEEIMQRQKYPHLASHRREHTLFMASVFSYLAEFNAGLLTADTLIDFLSHWLIKHIKTVDKDMVSSLHL